MYVSTARIKMYSESTEHEQEQRSKVPLTRPQAFTRSLAFALSARSTPTRILEAFHSWTTLMIFFNAEMGKQIRAMSSGQVRLSNRGREAEMGSEIGAVTQ